MVKMYILECKAFDEEKSIKYTNVCCSGTCHKENTFINVTPYASDATLENRRLDWELGIQGLVCCGRYEFVRSLSREWWVRALAKIDNWPEDKVRALLSQGSWHATFDKPTNRSQRPSSVKSSKVQMCPNCGSKWNEVACNDCGYSN